MSNSTKTLKISEDVHTQLKVYIAQTKGNMTSFVDAAILSALKKKSKTIKNVSN